MKVKLCITLLLATCLSLLAFGQDNSPKRPITDSEHSRMEHRARHFEPSIQNTPIAYGYVLGNGAVWSGSGNITASWNPTYNWYAIGISGVDYYFANYSTVVTTTLPYGNTNCQTDSVSGDLLVRCYTSSGSPTQADFGFIVF